MPTPYSHSTPHIVYVITEARLGGAQVHLLQLLAHAKPRYQATLVVGELGFLTDAATDLGIRTIIEPSLANTLRPERDVSAMWRLARTLNALRPSLVHAHSSKAGVLARAAGKLTGTPTVFTAHGWAFAEGVPILRRVGALTIERLAALLGSNIITVSDADWRAAVRAGITSCSQVTRIYNGIPDVPNFMRASHTSRRPVRIVMTARFERQKDHRTLLQAAALCPMPLRMLFLGTGTLLPEMVMFAQQARIGSCVEFLGERSDVPPILASSDIFVLTSRYEGLPISIIEAMRAGLPVVATAVGGVPELVQDGVNGFLTRRGDVDQLAQQLCLLVSSPEMRKRQGAAGRARYERMFTERTMLEQTRALYDRVLWQRASRSA